MLKNFVILCSVSGFVFVFHTSIHTNSTICQKKLLRIPDIMEDNLYGEGLWAKQGRSLKGKVREIEGGISSIPLDNYRILKIENRKNKGDSYTKIMHDQGLW